MKDQFSFIARPYITEKGTGLYAEQNKAIFQIKKHVNKIELKKAIESIFGVTVEKINTLNQSGKKRRLGRWEGRRSDWKKAIVTLKEGQTIEYFEGA
jgi:large subunit ribosomal protein L23